jgi:hypothetical protein
MRFTVQHSPQSEPGLDQLEATPDGRHRSASHRRLLSGDRGVLLEHVELGNGAGGARVSLAEQAQCGSPGRRNLHRCGSSPLTRFMIPHRRRLCATGLDDDNELVELYANRPQL